jgi:hypothetical protein
MIRNPNCWRHIKPFLMTDTSQMHEDMRTEHMLALKGMREMIFPCRASGQ